MYRDHQKTLFVSFLVVWIGLDLWLRFFVLDRAAWTCNAGVFWGVSVSPRLYWLLALMLLAGCLLLLIRLRVWFTQSMILLILLGGGVNMLDRFFYDCVLDYFSWPFGLSGLLPNFNLADILILWGSVGLIIFISDQKKSRDIDSSL